MYGFALRTFNVDDNGSNSGTGGGIKPALEPPTT